MSKGGRQFAVDQEVFETPDVPSEGFPSEDDRKSESVEVLNVSVRSSYSKFKGKSIDTRGTDFSNSLGRRPEHYGYKAEPEDLEMVSTYKEPETVMQRYQRLKQEVSELLLDVKTLKSDQTASEKALGVPLSDLAEDVDQLQKLLLSCEMQDSSLSLPLLSSSQQSFQSLLLRDLKIQLESLKPHETALQQAALYEVYTRTETEKFAQLSKLSELEERLLSLEALVGRNTTVSTVAGGLDAQHKDLSSAILNLQAKIALLDADHLEAINDQLQRLASLLGDVQSKAKSKVDDTEVSEALQTIKRLWTIAPLVPDLVSRLHSLKELHERAAQFAGSVSYMSSTQDEIAKQIVNVQGLLVQVQTSMEQNLSTIQANLSSLDSRISALKQ